MDCRDPGAMDGRPMISMLMKNLISITSNKDLYIKRRGLFYRQIKLHPDTYKAIIEASLKLKALSHDRYLLVVMRGYIRWGLFRRLKGKIGKILFSILFPKEKKCSCSIFSANGHDDGFSVDVTLYDKKQEKFLQFLSWKNVFISKKISEDLLKTYHEPINLLNEAMRFAGFEEHHDPREKLQAHYRFKNLNVI